MIDRISPADRNEEFSSEFKRRLFVQASGGHTIGRYKLRGEYFSICGEMPKRQKKRAFSANLILVVSVSFAS